jgi:hypothetical protein
MSTTPQSEFEKAAMERGKESLIREFVDFLAHNKKWWLLPIVVVMAFMGILILLSNSAVAPFIYTLF